MNRRLSLVVFVSKRSSVQLLFLSLFAVPPKVSLSLGRSLNPR